LIAIDLTTKSDSGVSAERRFCYVHFEKIKSVISQVHTRMPLYNNIQKTFEPELVLVYVCMTLYVCIQCFFMYTSL
jgi:hypothetical protein